MSYVPTEQQLNELRTYGGAHCLTMYAPYLEPNAPSNPNRIEIKNLIKAAKKELLLSGATESELRKTLRPIREYVEGKERWPTRGEGVVFFSSPGFFRYYHLPLGEMRHSVTVSTSFNVEPLAKAVGSNKEYLVLALGHKNIRLYKGDMYHMRRIALKDFPDNMEKALQIDEYPQSRETHTVAPTSMGKGSEGFHQQYNVRQVDKTMLTEFFRRIDKRLHAYLSRHAYPLILVGVEYVLALYRTVNTYPHVVRAVILGSPDEVSVQDIHTNARKIIANSKPV